MKHYPTSLLLIVVFLLVSCSNTHWLRKESVPRDVANPSYTLLIIKLSAAQSSAKYQQFVNEKLEKLVQSYPYPVELISEEELKSPKYTDVNKYRYVLRPTGNTARGTFTDVHVQPVSGISTRNDTNYDYSEQVFTDRKEGRDYPYSNYRVVRFDQGVKVIFQYIQKGK